MTKNYIISDTLEVGQYFEHNDILYVASKPNRQRPCIMQCHASYSDRCLGICYRFSNFKDFVLKKAHPTEETITVVETVFGKASRLYLEEIKKQMLNEIPQEQ